MQDSLSQWNNAANWYDQNMGTTGDTLNSTIIRPLILDMLGNLESKELLDVGCGSGYVTAELANSAKKVVGTDFSANFIALCRQKYENRTNLDFIEHDVMQSFPFNDASFDSIVCKMVLQYVKDIHVFAGEAKRLLKAGGELVVVVDNPFRAAYFNALKEDGPDDELFSGKPMKKVGLWGKTELTWYARTTSEYVQNFIDAGLQLTDIREPLEQVDTSNPIPFSVLGLKFTKEA